MKRTSLPAPRSRKGGPPAPGPDARPAVRRPGACPCHRAAGGLRGCTAQRSIAAGGATTGRHVPRAAPGSAWRTASLGGCRGFCRQRPAAHQHEGPGQLPQPAGGPGAEHSAVPAPGTRPPEPGRGGRTTGLQPACAVTAAAGHPGGLQLFCGAAGAGCRGRGRGAGRRHPGTVRRPPARAMRPATPPSPTSRRPRHGST